MSVPAFTPGPWALGERKEVLGYGHCGYDVLAPRPDAEGWETVWVATALGVHVGVPLGEIDANARLIVAAPDLHEALTKLLAAHEATHRFHEDDFVDPAVDAARAALAKAEGMAP